MWFFTVGFTLSFGALFAKTWQVYRVYTNPKLKKQVTHSHCIHVLFIVHVHVHVYTVHVHVHVYTVHVHVPMADTVYMYMYMQFLSSLTYATEMYM